MYVSIACIRLKLCDLVGPLWLFIGFKKLSGVIGIFLGGVTILKHVFPQGNGRYSVKYSMDPIDYKLKLQFKNVIN